MQRFIYSLLLISCCLSVNSSIGQELLSVVPETEAEFIESEQRAINTINWLENTPVDEVVDKRKLQMALLLAWLINSPTVTIEISYDVIKFTEKNPELLLIFMGGWAKFSLANEYSTDLLMGNMAGIESVIEVYKKGNGLKRDKKVDQLIQLQANSKLENWVQKQLKK